MLTPACNVEAAASAPMSAEQDKAADSMMAYRKFIGADMIVLKPPLDPARRHCDRLMMGSRSRCARETWCNRECACKCKNSIASHFLVGYNASGEHAIVQELSYLQDCFYDFWRHATIIVKVPTPTR
jgi:hypothetical protein